MTKNIIIYGKQAHFILKKMNNRESPTNYFIDFSGILFELQRAWNRKYTVLAAQGLTLQPPNYSI